MASWVRMRNRLPGRTAAADAGAGLTRRRILAPTPGGEPLAID
jgi:hypothetical protein